MPFTVEIVRQSQSAAMGLAETWRLGYAERGIKPKSRAMFPVHPLFSYKNPPKPAEYGRMEGWPSGRRRRFAKPLYG